MNPVTTPTPAARAGARRAAGTTWLLALLAACAPGDAAERATADLASAGSACTSAPASRWAGGAYERTAVYGKEPQGWLSSVNGVAATPDGRVAVLDGSAARVVVLDGDLRPVREFGRRGGGPGELAPDALMGMQGLQRTFNYLEATDSALFVYNAGAVSVFGWDGQHRTRHGDLRGGFIAPFTFRAMRAGSRGFLYGYDTLDMTGGRGHRMQTWAVRDDGRRRLVAEVPAISPPMQGTTFQVGTRQARALWAAHGSCVAMSDGGSAWLARVDAGSGTVDTLPLPPHDVPRYDPARDMQMTQRMAGLQGALGGGARIKGGLAPTLLSRWTEMVIDPDGYLWIRPWTPAEARESPVDAFRISLQTGQAQPAQLPAFPQAFGRAGEFYAVEKDPDTDELLLVQYRRTTE